jgi:predicted metalloendopeptidase
LLGKQKRQVRWKECLIQTIENLDQASGAVYVREKFKPEDFEMATIMVEELRAAYIRTFKANEWVSPEVKKYALKKVSCYLVHFYLFLG